MRALNITIKFEDNDLIEDNIRSVLYTELGSAITSIKTLPNTEDLKDDEAFKKLLKMKRQAQININNYIDKSRGYK